MEPQVVEKVEVPAEQAAPEAAEKPTREALTEKGWSEGEITAAEKRGMVAEKKAAPAPVVPPAVAPEAPAPAPAPEAKPKTVIAGVDDVDMTPEQEKVLLAMFPAGHAVRGLFFRQKNERRARQAAEDRARKNEEEIAALKAQLAGKPSAEAEDDEDQPLTVKRLRELQERQAAEQERLQNEQGERQAKVKEAAAAQEQYAKAVHADFDDALKLAADLVQNLDALVPEKRRQGQIVRLWQDLTNAAKNADQFDVEDYHAAFIAYEIGKLHPNYGKSAAKPTPKTEPAKDPKGDGGPLSPEKMDRVVKNSQRAVSSAAVTGGGGKVVVAAEDMTAEQLNRLPAKERINFRAKHPDHYRRLTRGG